MKRPTQSEINALARKLHSVGVKAFCEEAGYKDIEFRSWATVSSAQRAGIRAIARFVLEKGGWRQ